MKITIVQFGDRRACNAESTELEQYPKTKAQGTRPQRLYCVPTATKYILYTPPGWPSL